MIFYLFSDLEQRYGVANYGKAVWFKKMLGVIIPSIWRRLGAGGSASSLPARYENEKFIYQAPKDSEDVPVCLVCRHRENCCPNAARGRTINVSFDLLPHIDSQDPPMAKRYKAIMSRRTSVERMIKRLKCDLGDDRLTKRGNESFQAYLDKTMIAFHVLLRK